MWFNETDEVIEMFRNSFPLSFIFFIPIFIIISPVGPVAVAAAHEFSVYRMQQYDLQGTAYGCRNALVNFEARPVDSKVLTRRCVVTKLKELTIDKYRNVLSQSAGALLVLLPQNLIELDEEEQQHLLELEQDMMQEETQVPVYFTPETPELLSVYKDVSTAVNSDQAASAAEAMFSSAWANGFQMVVNGPQSSALSDFQVVNLQGKLTGKGIEEQLPTVAIVAHYDSYGVAPGLSHGADSNGSGAVALLELARLFSALYTNSRTHAKYNLLFLLSGAGKFNYHGTKRWIEDNLDTAESNLLVDASYVLCLDALASGDTLRLHVSKPPKEGSSGEKLVQNLEIVSKKLFPDRTFELIHKKINLAEELLAWEHERFSIRRLPAFTLSHLDSHKHLIRNSILDVRDRASIHSLHSNIRVLAEALARQIYNISSSSTVDVFSNGLSVEENLLSSWLDFLTSMPRSAQLLHPGHPIIASLEQTFKRYLKDVRKLTVKTEKRDPDFLFYSGADYLMGAYSVKPAVFDLFLALAISAYLAAIYFLLQFLLQNFSSVSMWLKTMISPNKSKIH